MTMQKFKTENGMTLGGDLVDEETGEIININNDDFIVNGKHIQAGLGTWLREDSQGDKLYGFDVTTDGQLDFYIEGAVEASLTATALSVSGSDVLVDSDIGSTVGNVFKVGTPANNQLGVWTGDGTIEGDSDLTWDTNVLLVSSAQATPLRLNGTGTQSRVAYYKSSTAKWSVGVNANDDFTFYDSTNTLTPFTIQDGSPSNTLYVASSGRVGVNTFQPSTALDVTGTITASADIVAEGHFEGPAEHSSTTSGTLAAGDMNTTISATGGITINNSIGSQGDIVIIYNNTAGNITLTQGTGVTLRLAGSTSSGNRTVATRGLACVYYHAANDVIVGGTGVT